MRERSAARILSVGYHTIRVESFENTGTAGLVLSWAGPGIVKQVIPAGRLFHDAPAALAFQQDPSPDGLVVMEAENHDGSVTRNGRTWRATSAPAGFSGVGAVRAAPNAGSVRSPRTSRREARGSTTG